MPTTQNLLEFIIALVFMNLSAIAIAIVTWRKSTKMLPKELQGVELDNRGKELNLANQYDQIAQKAADKALKVQERLDKLEGDHEILEKKVSEQADVIAQQATVIEAQSERMNAQEEEIAGLICELNNYKEYTSSLIDQMKQANIVPVERNITTMEDCKEKVKKSKKAKKE
jgi:hypothetical protein